jgi:hypothetical protein
MAFTHPTQHIKINDTNQLYSTVSNNDEWDYYEGLYNRPVERYAFTHPNDPDTPAMQQHIRKRYEMYLQQGRKTLGFGFYLFMKP